MGKPFGEEWVEAVMQKTKKQLVTSYKNVCIEKLKLEENRAKFLQNATVNKFDAIAPDMYKFLQDFTLLPDATLAELKGWQEEAAKIIKGVE